MRFLTPIIVVLLLGSVIGNMVMYAKYTSRRPVMTINGDRITKKDMYDYLEQNFSPEYKALQTKRFLVSKEAKKKKLSATDAEVQERYNDQKELNWQFVQRIRNRPWVADETKNEFRFEIEAGRLLIAKLNDVDEHEQLIFGVVVDHRTNREGEQTKVVLGEWFFKRTQDPFAKLTDARSVVLHQTLKQGFLAGVVGIDRP